MAKSRPAENLHGPALRPVKAAPVGIVATMSVAEACAAIVHTALVHLQANERGVLSGAHPEFLHQMRVALRRLRSAIAVFPGTEHSAFLTGELRWLSGRLSAARDWDVFMLETLPQVRESLPEVPGLDEVSRLSQRRRRAAWRMAQRTVASARYGALIQALRQELWRGVDAGADNGSEPVDLRSYATEVLRRRYAKVSKRGESLHKHRSKELHQLRIAIKKLRYPVEFFAPLFNAHRAREVRTRLTALQNVLGLINDGVTTPRLLRAARISDTPQLGLAAGMIADWAEGRAMAQRSRLDAEWGTFRGTKVFW
ncbi:MAG: CHAD domain-containing protein [Betaproteobacteria bacterium]